MVGAVTMTALHGVGDSVKGIYDAMRGFEETKQGVDDGVKGIGGVALIGVQKILNLSSLFSIFILLGVEKTGRQMASDPHTVHAGSLMTTNEANNKIEYVGNITRSSMRDTLEGALHSTGNSDNVHGPITGTVARGVEGVHIIRNLLSELLPSGS